LANALLARACIRENYWESGLANGLLARACIRASTNGLLARACIRTSTNGLHLQGVHPYIAQWTSHSGTFWRHFLEILETLFGDFGDTFSRFWRHFFEILETLFRDFGVTFFEILGAHLCLKNGTKSPFGDVVDAHPAEDNLPHKEIGRLNIGKLVFAASRGGQPLWGRGAFFFRPAIEIFIFGETCM
jgi:hypothetical protein